MNIIPKELTNREVEVYQLLLKGLKNNEIAQMLIISPHTSKAYVSRIFEKLAIDGRYELFASIISDLQAEILKLESKIKGQYA